MQPRAPTRWQASARALLLIEALAPLAGGGYGVVQLVRGQAVVLRNGASVVLLFLVLAGGLAVLAWGLGRGRRGARTASLVWQLMLLLAVVPALWQAGRAPVAVGVAALAVLSGYASVRATTGPAAREV